MPGGPGESLLTTLFADVHYYFSNPVRKPQHDRFNRGSYTYLFHNTSTSQVKLEIANNAGTPEQDALTGYLNVASVQYSYKQPCLCTIVIEETVQDQSQWRLPSYDLKNEQKYLYQLHSLDIYLWTEKDAATFLGHLRSVIPASRLNIKGAPSTVTTPASVKALPAEHRDSMSPVVQLLERTAVATHFPPRAESALSVQSFPAPPTPATSGGASASPPVSPPQIQTGGYNPMAPAAPEFIAHREKTPPPPDAGQGTGLAGAAKYDAVPQYASVPSGYQSHSGQPTPQHAYFSGPPQHTPQPGLQGFAGPPGGTPPNPQRAYSTSIPPPPPGGPSPQPQQQYAPSFAAPPPPPPQGQPTSPPPQQQDFSRQSSYGGPPGQSQYASYPAQQQTTQYASVPPTPSFGPFAASSPGLPSNTPGYQNMQPPTPSAPPAYSNHTPLQSPGLPPPPSSQPPQHQQQQQQPVIGYSNFNYTSAQAPQQLNQYGAYTGGVHDQVYRPTEGEAAHGHGHGESAARKPRAERQGSGTGVRMEERVTGVEKRVGGFLKRLDKLI